MSVNELLHSVGQLGTREFEAFFSKIQSLRLHKTVSDVRMEEHKLLKQIKTNAFSVKKIRFEYLIARRDARAITDMEFEELVKLTHEMEKNDLINQRIVYRAYGIHPPKTSIF